MRRITLEEALKLVDFTFDEKEGWQVQNVKCSVTRSVCGNVHVVKGSVNTVKCDVIYSVRGDVAVVEGNVGTVRGSVMRSVKGNVWGTIDGRKWQFVETSEEKLKRLIEETKNSELIELFNQMENNQ